MAQAKRNLVSISHAAEHASVCTRTVRRWISQGDLVGYRLGKRIIRVDLNELDAMLRPIPSASGGDRVA